MPLIYEQNINSSTRLGVWHITEPESFFLTQVPLQREITHPNKRLQHLAGRLLLKVLYPDFPYELIRIADTRKPFLENEVYHFSISHCGAYAAVIVSKDHRVGVDVELITPKVERVKHKFLSAHEQELLGDVEFFPWHLFSDHLLTAAWSIKESLFKWQATPETDFIRHLLIRKITAYEHAGFANCRIERHGGIDLAVQFVFLEQNCLSWVLTRNLF
jgi:4'-phosphopantetheinyl transferase EntD